MRKNVVGRRVAGAIRSLVNARGLQLDCARVLHESLLVPVLMYGSDTMIFLLCSDFVPSSGHKLDHTSAS